MRRRYHLLIPAGTAILVGLLATGTSLHLMRGDRAARSAAIGVMEADARGIATAVERQMVQTDGLLAGIPILLTSLSDAGLVITPRAAVDLLNGLSLQNLAVRDIMLISPGGDVWASSLGPADRRPEGVDPRIFSESRITNPSKLVGPIRNRASGDWSIFLVRHVVVPGRGVMVATAEISVPALLTQVGDLRQAAGAQIVIEKPTGEVIATLPHDERLVGKVRRLGAPAPSRLSQGTASADEEFFSVARHSVVGDISVLLRSPIEAAVADWRAERDRSLTAALAAAALIVLAAGALFALVRRNARIGQERARITAILEYAVEGMADGFVLWDADDRLVTCNEVYREIYALSRPRLVPGTPFEEIIRWGVEVGQYPESVGREEAFVEHLVAWHRMGTGAIERQLPDGRWVLIRERRLKDGGIVGIRTDITAIKKAQAELAEATEQAREAAEEARRQNLALRERDRELHVQNALFEAALNNMSHGLLMADGEDRVIVANPRLAELFGVDRARLKPGAALRRLRAAAREARAIHPLALDEMSREQGRLARERAWGSFVSQVPDGRVIAVTQRPLEKGGWIAIYEDVTVQQKAERRIAFLAHHDELTGLPNRACFREELDRRLSGGGRFALLCLDLDGFKAVNDTHGHQAGDALLRQVAERLRARFASADLVARLGGDEFAIIHRDHLEGDELLRFGQGIVAELSRAFDSAGGRLVIGASIGIAVTGEGIDRETILRNADLALYQAKAAGRGACRVFDPALEERWGRRLALEQNLRDAVAQEELSVAYQPIFDLREKRVVAFEALARWHHPERGMVSPGEFIPLAEEIGMISRIGAFVLNKACLDIALLPGEIRVAVNLSAQQLRTEEIVQTVVEALRASALAPDRLELEITETALLADNVDGARILERLSGLGVRIALDDFGTGYSSLSHLRNFPLDKIKIDRSFVGEIASNPESAAIVTSLIDLADKLGMTTTAEGIETEEQLGALRAAGCTEAQGYLLGRPRSILHALETVMTPPPVLTAVPRRLSA
jgi:diguanylate cyclase (GGDEF)-like protein